MPKSLVAEQSSWATASHTSSASTLASQRQLTPSPPSPPPRSRSKRERTPLEAYFHEQSKLFSHLEKRFAKFNARAADEKARARKERRRPAAPIKKFQKAPNQAASSLPPPIGPRPPSQPVVMIGPKAGTAVKSVIRQMGASAIPGSSRALSTTLIVAKAGGKMRAPPNPDAMALAEAVRVLRALEIANPSSAYSLTLTTRHSKSSLPLRGRVALPTDARKSSEVILVFADPSSPSADIARAAGATYVGGEELFPQVLSGEIAPTKVLATPGLMGSVQQKLARFLGPKGLMPVAKRGGVGEGEELGKRVKEAGGLMEWKADKLGVVRAPVARMTFEVPDVDSNVRAFVAAVRESSSAAAASAADAANSRKRQPSGIITARLETTNGPSIELNDVL